MRLGTCRHCGEEEDFWAEWEEVHFKRGYTKYSEGTRFFGRNHKPRVIQRIKIVQCETCGSRDVVQHVTDTLDRGDLRGAE